MKTYIKYTCSTQNSQRCCFVHYIRFKTVAKVSISAKMCAIIVRFSLLHCRMLCRYIHCQKKYCKRSSRHYLKFEKSSYFHIAEKVKANIAIRTIRIAYRSNFSRYISCVSRYVSWQL